MKAICVDWSSYLLFVFYVPLGRGISDHTPIFMLAQTPAAIGIAE